MPFQVMTMDGKLIFRLTRRSERGCRLWEDRLSSLVHLDDKASSARTDQRWAMEDSDADGCREEEKCA